MAGMMFLARLAPVLVLSLAVGCASDPQPDPEPQPDIATDHFTLASLGLGPMRASGMARDARTGNLWLLVPARGLVEITAKGAFVSEIKYGEKGLRQTGLAFNDVTVLDNGKFALTANGEGYVYDPAHQTLEFFFCLVPSFEPIQMVNEAITYDDATGRIFVAPAYYDSSGESRRLTRALLAQYSGSDGAALVEHDVMASGVVAKGLAWDAESRGVWALDGAKLTFFTQDGQTDGRTIQLTGIESGAGVVLAGDRFWVLDGYDDELRSFARIQ